MRWPELFRRAPPQPPAAPAPTQAKARPATPPTGGHVIVSVLGLTGEALEQIVDLAVGQCKATGTTPVFVIDHDDFSAFRGKRQLVEQVVDAERMALQAGDLLWRLHRERQCRLLALRWQPRTVIFFGRRPDEACIAALRGK